MHGKPPRANGMETEIKRKLRLDHKMIIEGVQYHKKKELEKFLSKGGVEMCTLSHSRSIEDRTYTAIQKFVDREVKDHAVILEYFNIKE